MSMPNGNGKRTYSPETKAQVMAALLAGQSISQVADEYRMPRSTVGSWSAELNRQHVYETDPNTKKEIGSLLLEYVRAVLTTLQAQTEVFRDAKWIRQQDASEVAVLHGVLADKAFRLLEALSDSTVTEGQDT